MAVSESSISVGRFLVVTSMEMEAFPHKRKPISGGSIIGLGASWL